VAGAAVLEGDGAVGGGGHEAQLTLLRPEPLYWRAMARVAVVDVKPTLLRPAPLY